MQQLSCYAFAHLSVSGYELLLALAAKCAPRNHHINVGTLCRIQILRFFLASLQLALAASRAAERAASRFSPDLLSGVCEQLKQN